MNDLDLSYVAGFFDGEGSITIHENYGLSPRGKSPNHTLQVSIGNTDPSVIRWIHEEWGGHFALRKRSNPKHKPVYQWIIRAALALPFLEAIRPFVKMKRRQVDVAIAFQKTKKRHNLVLSKAEIDWREGQRLELRILNGRNTHLKFREFIRQPTACV